MDITDYEMYRGALIPKGDLAAMERVDRGLDDPRMAALLVALDQTNDAHVEAMLIDEMNRGEP